MKKNCYLFLLGIVFFPIGLLGTVPSPVIHLPLNEDANATSFINLGTNSTITAVPVVTTGVLTSGVEDPQKGKVCYFNSNYNAFINLKQTVAEVTSDFPGATGGVARTYSFWVKPDGLAFSAFLNSGIGPTQAFDIQCEAVGNPRVGDGTNYTKMYDIALKNMKWSHLAFVMTENAGMHNVKMYINGRESVPWNVGTNATVNTATNGILKLFQKFKGWASDFKYFDSSLTANQIREIYGKKDLLLHYKFDEASGAVNVVDYSGNNYSGTLSGIFLLGESDGQKGNVAKLGGSTLEAIGFKGVLGDNPRTVAFWYKQDAAVFSNISYYGSGADQFQMQVSGAGSVTVYNSFSPAPSYTVAPGPYDFTSWKHIAIVTDGSDASLIQVYIDGSPAIMETSNITKNILYTISAGDMKVLNDASGYISDYRVYAGAMNQNEIAAIVSGITGEKDVYKSFDAYPSVTEDLVFFKEPVDNIKIFNLSGSVVKESTHDQMNSISLKYLPTGMYLLQLNNHNFVKVIKK